MIDEVIERLDVAAYTIPTDLPEADGTLAWNSTTIVIVYASGSGETGLGYSYADVSAARLITDKLAFTVLGRRVMDVPGAFAGMVRQIRNLGRPGICSMAIARGGRSAVGFESPPAALAACEIAGAGSRCRAGLWQRRIYFLFRLATAESTGRLGQPRIARREDEGRNRTRARSATGFAWRARRSASDVELFVDANGAYTRKQALPPGRRVLRSSAWSWFEEPVTSDDLGRTAVAARRGTADDDRRRRVRLPSAVFQRDARSGARWTCCRRMRPDAASTAFLGAGRAVRGAHASAYPLTRRRRFTRICVAPSSRR